jgi:hypothetical protein
MKTEDHNKIRTDKWGDRFNKDESKIFLMVGKKKDGTYTFSTDLNKNPFAVAQELQIISKAINKKYKTS